VKAVLKKEVKLSGGSRICETGRFEAGSEKREEVMDVQSGESDQKRKK